MSWQPGDIVISRKHGNILERGETQRNGDPRWYPLSPAGFEIDEDPTDVVLLARRVDGQRIPVVSLADGELYAIRTVGPPEYDHEPQDALLPYFGPEDNDGDAA